MSRAWSGKTDGTRWMQNALIVIFRYIDVRFMYIIMAIVILFYMLFRHSTYIAIYNYFRQCYNNSPIQALFNTYKNHYIFGQVILDRFAVYAGKKYEFITEQDDIVGQCPTDEGMILISSHIGNYEMAGYLNYSSKPMHVLAFDGETGTVMENRIKQFGQNNIHVIPVKDDMSHVFAIHDVLEKGDIVSMHGDRMLGSQKYVSCNVFGRKAPLPLGPFQIAVSSHKKIGSIFVMKDSWNTYHIFSFTYELDRKLSRKEQILDLAQRYATNMETMARKYPYQWFHYYDFWNIEEVR